MTIKQKFDRMKAAMEAAGYPVVTTKGRGKAAEFWPRAVIAYHLYGGRWYNRRVGDVLNRDHSTVTWMRQRVKDALDMPTMYDDVITMIQNFRDKYYELFGQDI